MLRRTAPQHPKPTTNADPNHLILPSLLVIALRATGHSRIRNKPNHLGLPRDNDLLCFGGGSSSFPVGEDSCLRSSALDGRNGRTRANDNNNNSIMFTTNGPATYVSHCDGVRNRTKTYLRRENQGMKIELAGAESNSPGLLLVSKFAVPVGRRLT